MTKYKDKRPKAAEMRLMRLLKSSRDLVANPTVVVHKIRVLIIITRTRAHRFPRTSRRRAEEGPILELGSSRIVLQKQSIDKV